MASRPQLIVEIAFGSARALGNPTTAWVDVTAYVRGVAIKGGRQHELDRVQASTCDVRLRNVGGQFDPAGLGAYATTPFSRLRVRAVVAGTTYDLFHGYVEQFEQTYPGGAKRAAGDAEVIAHAVDALKILGLFPTRSTRTLVAAMDPWVYYRMWDPESHMVNTLQPEAVPDLGRATNQVAAYPLSAAGQGAVAGKWPGSVAAYHSGFALTFQQFSKSGQQPDMQAWNAWNELQDETLCVWYRCDQLVAGRSGLWNNGKRWTVSLVGNAGQMDALFSAQTPGIVTGTVPGVAPDDAGWHHYAFVRAVNGTTDQTFTVYVDGVLKGSVTLAGDPNGYTWDTTVPYVDAIGVLGRAWDPAAAYDSSGTLAHFGAWDRQLSAADIALLASATLDDPGSEALTGTMLGDLLRSSGWPSTSLALDPGASTLAPAVLAANVLDAALTFADADGGVLYVRGDGAIRFRDRNALWSAATPPTMSDDPATPGAIPYADLTISSDDSQTYTRVEVKGASGSVYVAEDAAATTTYGLRVLSLDLVALSDADAQARANYLLALYATQRARATGAAFTLARDDVSAFVLGAQLLDRVTVSRTTPGGHTWSQVSWIEGWELTMDGRSPWAAKLDLVPAIAP